MQWLSTSHTSRHRSRTGTVGEGHLYQGRYKSFPIEEDFHLLSVLRYIERNAVRAGLCKRAEDWKWGSAHARLSSTEKQSFLAEFPIDLPSNYLDWLNTSEPFESVETMRVSVNKGLPYGNVNTTAHITQ